ncbi:PLAC8-like protein 1 isoform X1 [Cyclopterus lumpus]|uniref:PLAC8-like protein 1 isoform X1 n=1 Tax=Cyclopterus lumpus TaxID=8103 RepID=UPI0014874E07|nr:PLAC8-like protein 1 isoform X1 [Cyclopterus lumpus]XP_034406628.1 PLAC8-like protein 1 isoform X1 [Cyclopterus lumpus]
MEQMTVTHQPRLSVTHGSASAIQKEKEGGVTTGSENDLRSNNVPAVTDPVLTQPGLGITTTTITTITQTGGDWSSGLFDVCGDKTTCILGALVPCCLDLSLAHQYGECLCMPLLPGSTFAMRVGIRERFKIRRQEFIRYILSWVKSSWQHFFPVSVAVAGHQTMCLVSLRHEGEMKRGNINLSRP